MKRTILIVEDNAADTQLLLRALDKANFGAEFVRAKDGDEAVAYLDRSAQQENGGASAMPCMILLDIKLPRRSGFEVLAWIRKDPRPLRRIPVVMLTSSKHSIDVNRAFELGANAYTVKPDTSALLVALVERIKAFWMLSNEFPIVTSPANSPLETLAVERDQNARPVLLIEDERADAMLITRGFARAGFPGVIQHAPDGATALKWLDDRIASGDQTQLPAFVLLDLKLPGISGLDLLDQIRSKPAVRTIPVVVLAGANDAHTINQAYERGANSYLVKSANPEDVSRLVGFVKQYWLTMNQNSGIRTVPVTGEL
jgi:CheY-like chemotaxis protein